MSKQFDCSKHQRMLFLSKNRGIDRLHLGVTIRFVSSSSINSSDAMLGCESSPLSPVHSSEDGAVGFFHVSHEEEASYNTCRSTFVERSRCSHVSKGVHQACLISTIITPKMNN